MKLSVALATYNEAENLDRCLKAVKGLADEIVIVDGGSTDDTLKIAEKYQARIIKTNNPPNFHINKQKALEAAQGEWVLNLDADEVVSSKLAQDIKQVVSGQWAGVSDQQKSKLFERH